MTDNLIADMIAILIERDTTSERIESALREFHQKHSFNKNVVISYWDDAMRILKVRAYKRFRERKTP